MFLDIRMISHYILIVALSMKKKMTKGTLCVLLGGGGGMEFSLLLTTFISRGKELNTDSYRRSAASADGKFAGSKNSAIFSLFLLTLCFAQ